MMHFKSSPNSHSPKNPKKSPKNSPGTVGLSYGALIGLQITDYMIILNSDDAVSAFSGGGQVRGK